MAGGGAAVPGGRRKAGFLLREASGSPAEHLFPPLSTEDSVGLDSVEALPSTFRCHATASSSSLPSWSTFGLGWLVMRYLAAGCGREDGYNYNQVHHCYHGRGEQHSTTSGSPDREGVFQAQGRCAPVQNNAQNKAKLISETRRRFEAEYVTEKSEKYDPRDVERLQQDDNWVESYLIWRHNVVDETLKMLDESFQWRKEFAVNAHLESDTKLNNACILVQDPFKYSYPPLVDDDFQTPLCENGPIASEDETSSKEDIEGDGKESLETISNEEQPVLSEKVRTTAPEKYRVKPSNSSCDPGASVDIIVSPHGGLKVSAQDRFLIMAAEMEQPSGTGPTELTQFWKEVPRSKVMEHRLRCHTVESSKPNTLMLKDSAANMSDKTSEDLYLQLNRLLESNRKLEDQLQRSIWFQQLLLALTMVLLAFVVSFFYSLYS
ncbi:Motile sperm domain-containing protein 2 [Cricetulus griseus]|uniref:Motile sperm domain-containing protein 2 n=1 Tax=Cricetulus griseus TaxID=10029 RepID=G3HH98_CRIGR|nr:Motile sperm domain-containing protein 2 [Cricetulus griseus]